MIATAHATYTNEGAQDYQMRKSMAKKRRQQKLGFTDSSMTFKRNGVVDARTNPENMQQLMASASVGNVQDRVRFEHEARVAALTFTAEQESQNQKAQRTLNRKRVLKRENAPERATLEKKALKAAPTGKVVVSLSTIDQVMDQMTPAEMNVFRAKESVHKV